MSELVLIASDLYHAASGAPPGHAPRHLPVLSRIARYGTVEPLRAGWRAWLAAWLGREDLASASPASIASAAPRAPARTHATAEPQTDFLWLADPVHLVAGPTTVLLAPGGLLALDAQVQQELCSAFESVFADSGYRLEPARGGRFLARGPVPAASVRTTEPARALGSSLTGALPEGGGASALRALGAEIEMWLHEHPINIRRARAGQVPISTLWLWGGGPPLVPGPADSARDSASTAVFGDDAFMEGIARLCGARFATAPVDLAALATARAQRRAIALEQLRTEEGASHADPLAMLERFERDWVVPAFEQLARGELSRLTILVSDRQLSMGLRDRFRLWRRPRPALAVLQ